MSDRDIARIERMVLTGDIGIEEGEAQLRHYRLRAGQLEVESRVYTILVMNLPALEKKCRALTRRLIKVGVRPLELIEQSREWREKEIRGETMRLCYVTVEVKGDMPELKTSWDWVAALHHKEHGTILQRLRNADLVTPEDLERFRLRGPACDHCGLRRKRNDTYVVRHRVEGTVVQVGRTCLQDHLGCDPRAALYRFEADQDLDTIGRAASEPLDDSVEPEAGVLVSSVLLHACAIVRASGSRPLTCSRPSLGLRAFGRSRNGSDRWEPVDHEVSQLVLDAIKDRLIPRLNLEDDTADKMTEQDHNLGVAVAEGTVAIRHADLIGWALRWFERETGESILDLCTNGEREARREELEGMVTRELVHALAVVAPDLRVVELAPLFTEDPEVRLEGIVELILHHQFSNGSADPDDGKSYIGKVGEWVTIRDLRVVRLHTYMTREDNKTAVVLVSEGGRWCVWFASGDKTHGPKRLTLGHHYRVRALVRAHGTDSRNQDRPQTVLTRCRLTPVEA